ncbi:hypothetical protein PIB30_069242 [Stylosanthes scabra]|uniref:Uncharacterized protein n=1 Tax=Stylosanthes scabra TaxID=79078 RepID=A0ABU6VPZ3_9FABA|nr:hypothetical protein [Stylosanthes scabra]
MMKHLVLVILLAVFVHDHAHDGTTTVEAAGDGFVRTRGIHFLLNGNPFYANGFNAYWLIYAASDPSQRYKVSSAFHEATRDGLTVARTWDFSDGGYKPLQYAPRFYNEQMFKEVWYKADMSLVNNYESFGGKKQYVNWARSKGQYLTSDDDFFRSTLVKGYYADHVKEERDSEKGSSESQRSRKQVKRKRGKIELGSSKDSV